MRQTGALLLWSEVSIETSIIYIGGSVGGKAIQSLDQQLEGQLEKNIINTNTDLTIGTLTNGLIKFFENDSTSNK